MPVSTHSFSQTTLSTPLARPASETFLCASVYGIGRIAPSKALTIAVIGTGYVGLVSGVCLAAIGHHVIGVDTNLDKIKSLQAGETPLYEQGLPELQQEAQRQGNLVFTHALEEALTQAKVCMLAVGTPQRDDGSADLTALHEVVETIIRYYHTLKERFKPQVLVVKSTVPVGTCTVLQTKLTEAGVALQVISNPEFLKQGVAVHDFMVPERVLVGSLWGEHTQTLQAHRYLDTLMRTMYQPWIEHQDAPIPYVHVSRHSAEMAKYACNAFLATKISFMNEMASLCELMGADVQDVKHIMGLDERIGAKFLQAGIGYGGSCFPKDVKALHAMAHSHAYEAKILRSVDETNKQQPLRFLHRVKQSMPTQNFQGCRVAIWGLAFKPDTDDMREAPSIPMIRTLLNEGAEVHVYDPEAMPNAQKIFQTLLPSSQIVHYHPHALSALQEADVLLVLTEWHIFKTIPASQIRHAMHGNLIADGRHLFDVEAFTSLGMTLLQIGRPSP
ncbi:MAG: UDP-glucose dehydrogenase family protein [Vampirovibrionales bacterium]